MTTIRAYTTIEQSKKLTEILPLESADMMYQEYETVIGDDYGYSHRIQHFFSSDIEGIPCWSLAALLGVLPEIKGCKPIIALDDNYITYPHISDLHTKADNPVDACYELILKLNEFKML